MNKKYIAPDMEYIVPHTESIMGLLDVFSTSGISPGDNDQNLGDDGQPND